MINYTIADLVSRSFPKNDNNKNTPMQNTHVKIGTINIRSGNNLSIIAIVALVMAAIFFHP